MKRFTTACVLIVGVLATCGAIRLEAAAPTAAIREAAEYIVGKFGKGAAGETVEQVSENAAVLVAKHGDEALALLRRSGHVGYQALETAGERSPEVIKLFAKRGDEAVWIISEPKKLALFLKHGDSAAEALVKHPAIADDLIARFGDDASRALTKVSREHAQQLGIVLDPLKGELRNIAREPELLAVVARYGDPAAEFIWKHKKSLAVAAVLTAFLADPEPFLNGTRDFAGIVGENLVKPLAEVPGKVATEAALKIDWTVVVIVIVMAVSIVQVWRAHVRHKALRQTTAKA